MLPAASRATPTRTPADNQTVRNVFVVGPGKKIKLVLAYPMTTGRNFDEVLRAIDSLQLTAKHRVATPVDWKQGEDVVIAGSVSTTRRGDLRRLEGAQAVHPDRAAAGQLTKKPALSAEDRPRCATRLDRTAAGRGIPRGVAVHYRPVRARPPVPGRSTNFVHPSKVSGAPGAGTPSASAIASTRTRGGSTSLTSTTAVTLTERGDGAEPRSQLAVGGMRVEGCTPPAAGPLR